MNRKTFVIAEAGANHNRDLNVAKRLIYSAASAGAHAVKFQSYTSSRLYSSNTPDFGIYKNIPDLISSIELPVQWHSELKKISEDCGLEFISTPFDEESVDLLFNLGVKRLKIAAFEARDTRLLKKVAQTKLPVIFSAGIGTGIREVSEIIDFLESEGSGEITILHCNSSYPTPFKDINLGQIIDLNNQFGYKCKIGLSDHTEGILIPPIAVTHGASVIEKHFTISKKMDGPDHPFAIEPHELFEMCRNIEYAEISMGKKESTYTDSEKNNEMFFALRSVVAKTNIRKGEKLTPENITTKRPYVGGNIPAEKYDKIISGNYYAVEELQIDTMIKESQIIS